MSEIDKQTRRAAVRGEVLERVEDGKRIVDVYGGRLAFDGELVTLTTAFMPRGTVTFRATDIRVVQWKDAKRMWNGTVQFDVPGASDRPQTANYYTKTGSDERRRYELSFMVDQAPVVSSLIDAIEDRMRHA